MLWTLSAAIKDSIDWHGHDIFECVYCRSGSGWLEVEDRKIDLRPGRSIVIAPAVRHRYRLQPGEVAKVKALCLNRQDVALYLAPAQLAFLDSVKQAAVSYADHRESAARVWDVVNLIPDRFNIGDVRELGVVWGAIGLFLAMHVKASEIPEEYAWRQYRQKIEKILEWIDTRLHETMSLEEVGTEFGLSRSLLTREFRRHTGKSLIDYCNGRRIERAATILAAGEKSVTSAALESGFSNLSHFHRQFKVIYGLTPAAFRRQVASGRMPA